MIIAPGSGNNMVDAQDNDKPISLFSKFGRLECGCSGVCTCDKDCEE